MERQYYRRWCREGSNTSPDGEGREAGQWTVEREDSCHSPPANKDKGRHLVLLSRFLLFAGGRSISSGRQLAAMLTRIVVAYPVPSGKQMT